MKKNNKQKNQPKKQDNKPQLIVPSFFRALNQGSVSVDIDDFKDKPEFKLEEKIGKYVIRTERRDIQLPGTGNSHFYSSCLFVETSGDTKAVAYERTEDFLTALRNHYAALKKLSEF